MSLPALEQLQVLCLDLDDTILDNRSGMRSAWQAVAAMLAEAHRDLAPDSVVEQLGRSTRWFWSDPTRVGWGRVDLPGARREIVGHVLAAFEVSDPPLAAEAARTYSELRHSNLRLHPGVHDLLERFQQRLPCLALVTNGSAPVQREKLERFGLEPYFHHVQLEGEFGVGKPDPAVYRNVMRVLGASPEACLMVGDDYEADVLGALAVGMSAAWIDVTGRGRTPVEPPRPHTTVRSLHELAERLGL